MIQTLLLRERERERGTQCAARVVFVVVQWQQHSRPVAAVPLLLTRNNNDDDNNNSNNNKNNHPRFVVVVVVVFVVVVVGGGGGALLDGRTDPRALPSAWAELSGLAQGHSAALDPRSTGRSVREQP